MIRQDYGDFQDMATQHMLAPILVELVAPDGGFVSGDLFIFNNELYKVIVDITAGDPIVIGDGTGASDNAIPASTIVEEIDNEIDDLLSELSELGSIMTMTQLYSGNSNESSITLADNINNYTFIAVSAVLAGITVGGIFRWRTTSGYQTIGLEYKTTYCAYSLSNNKTVDLLEQYDNRCYIRTIYGIKLKSIS